MEVTIDDNSGTFEDATLASYIGPPSQRDNNWGGYHLSQWRNGSIAHSNSVIMFVDLTAYAGVIVVSAKYILECSTKVGATFTVTVNPVLREWNEGNKTNSLASTGEVTANSARHLEQLWTVVLCEGSGTDYNATAAASFTSPSSIGSFDVNLTAQSVQDKIDGTNYGDIFRVPVTGTESWFYTDSSESSGTKPVFYFEYTEGVAIALSRSRLINSGGTLGGLTKSTLNNLGGA